MATLTQSQLDFLKRHKIDPSEALDASGMSRSKWPEVMKAQQKRLAYGSSIAPCDKGGHTLRTRKGHCAQCNPSSLSFSARYAKTAHVYIIGSARSGLIKIGLTENEITERLANINSELYGGADDWLELAISETVKDSGRIEANAQKSLEWARVEARSLRPNRQHDSMEVFACCFTEARAAVTQQLPKGVRLKLLQSPLVLQRYVKPKAA